MQNAPAMLAQKMMSRQAPYGPVGMVAQNMSGNKKISSPYMSVSASVLPIAVGKYDVYVFNASGTFTVRSLGSDPTEGSKVEYLVISGGGGGGNTGGGGAGGYLAASEFSVAAQTYAITVGAGGNSAEKGVRSIFSSISPFGGGNVNVVGPYGSGHGGSAPFTPGGSTESGGLGTAGQGNNGGTGFADGTTNFYGGAGGGGAGGVGQDFQGGGVQGGNGGAGLTSSITGTAVARGGGGGGAGSTTNGTATAGGGVTTVNTGNGTANTGGGGAGNGSNRLGGSGVVIIKVRARA